MSTKVYIEDNPIVLPVLKNGVTRLGDLWDCHQSVPIGENLFHTKNLYEEQYINASPIESLDYNLIHSKSTSEELKTVKVGGEVSLELLNGLISVKGGADFKDQKKKSSKIEKLICYYERETYLVNVEELAKNVMNDRIVKRITNRELNATHFVRAVRLGAVVRADIEISKTDSNSLQDISGDFFGKLSYGPISASMKACLGFLDSADNKDYKKQINVHSMPGMDIQTDSIEEMFKMVESVGAIIKDHKHFVCCGAHVIGVPISFQLVPIKQFLNFEIERIYIKLTEKSLKDFCQMLIKIHDIQVPDYFAKRVLNKCPQLALILNDEHSSLSTEIREYETRIISICLEYSEKSMKTFRDYKISKANEEQLLSLKNEFESKCNSTEMHETIIEFVEKGEEQLRSVHSVDIKGSKKFVEVLTNDSKLKNFIVGDSETKIWLKTDHKSPADLFIRFYKMVEPLNQLGCRVGVAVQAVSKKFELCLKVNGKQYSYDNKVEIPFILSIIGAIVGVGFENELLFHSLNAEIYNTKLPVKSSVELLDINNIIEKLKNLVNVKIAKSHLDTLVMVAKQDNRYKFFIPIDVPQTSYQAIRYLANLLMSIKSDTIDWIAGNLNRNDIREAGFLYIVYNSKVLAVCLDDYDLVLLKQKFSSASLTDLTDCLSPKQMDNSFYPQRVRSSEIIIKNIEVSDYKHLNLNFYGLKNFEEQSNEKVLNALELSTCLMSRNSVKTLGILAKYALKENQNIKSCLLKAGYSVTNSGFNQNILSDESKLMLRQGVEEIMIDSDRLASKIHLALILVKEYDTISEQNISEYELKVNKAIDGLLNDDNCSNELRKQIDNFARLDLKIKCFQMKSILGKYETEGEKNFHLKNLSYLLNSTHESDIKDVCNNYINRITIDDKIFGSIKKDISDCLKSEHFYQLIANLDKCSHGVKYYIIHQGLQNYCQTSNHILAVDQLIGKLIDRNYFNEHQWEELWKNNRFVILIRTLINDKRISGKLLSMGCEKSVPLYVPIDIGEKINESRIDNKELILPEIIKHFDEFSEIFKENPLYIESKEFISLKRIIEKPVLSGDNLKDTVVQVMPYIMQKIKMWGCNALTADSIALLSGNEFNSETDIKSKASNRPKFGGKPANSGGNRLEQQNKTTTKTPLSRLDTIVGIINSVDPIVGQDVLNIMAKFPMAIPLIIRSVYEKKKYKVLIPWLTQPIIKWESSPGKITENHLFKSPFKIIVALRIGDVSNGKCGKSSLLNQLFATKNIFSCCGEPGAKRNKAVTLSGTAEMVWLTQETVSSVLWQSVLMNHYMSDRNELLILVNLHGNALDFPEHMDFLKSIATAYILFIMPNGVEDLGEKFSEIESKLGLESGSDRLSYIAINPNDCEPFEEEFIIDTTQLTDDSNISKLRALLKKSIENQRISFDIKCLKDNTLLELTEYIETEASNILIEFIQQNSCQTIKENLCLQKVTGNNPLLECSRIWTENKILQTIIQLMTNVLNYKIDSRLKAMVHLEKELGILSSNETASARKEYREAQEIQRFCIPGNNRCQKAALDHWELKIKQALEKIDKINVGLEHLFREFGKLYEMSLLKNPTTNQYDQIACSYAELLIAGQGIELMDGESSNITRSWLTAICYNVYQMRPNLRVFVISILGLQSSGKSTLLNAMFATKFAVSVGRCTRGLFMRLLFLDEEMQKSLSLTFDAILLIDTEGLSAPGKQNEPDSEKKDRVMATLAMGISHLTIINVLGEYMNNLTEILQMTIVSMARLEKVNISPDILMVQHLTERNNEIITNATKQFSDALEIVIDMADKKDPSLGIRISKSLEKLRNTITLGKLFRQFRPFKNGASAYSPPSDEYHQDIIALYESIIEIAKTSGSSSDFKSWTHAVRMFWSSVTLRAIRSCSTKPVNNP